MELEDAPELNRNLESQIKEMDLEDHLIRFQASTRFRSWDLLRFCYALPSATGSPPGSGIWTCRFRAVRIQPSEYI